jgi:hypothetical protein
MNAGRKKRKLGFKMPRIISIEVTEPREVLLQRLVDRNRRLNRHAIEAVERTWRIVEQLGGIDRLEQYVRANEVLDRIEASCPGSWR